MFVGSGGNCGIFIIVIVIMIYGLKKYQAEYKRELMFREELCMEKELFIKQLKPFLYLLDEAHEATGYIVVGDERVCVIDTMNGYNDLHKVVREITEADRCCKYAWPSGSYLWKCVL